MPVIDIHQILRAFALVPLGYPAEEKEQQDRFDEARIHWMRGE